ncbi:MAG: response regulator [Vicinamibacteria bacterium]
MAKKILLADDSITIQKVIELTFSDEDFDVITVGNGRLALERLAEVRPDVVLCDIIMPEKDGYEVCEQIKSNPQWSHVPVLLLTGAFEPFDQERASRAGYDGSLAKPFEPETLIAKVKDLLARAPRPAAPTPSTPPIVPFARPTAAVPPPMSGLPPLPPPVISGGFITDEPFPEAEEPPPAAPAAGEAPPLAALTAEESRMLSGPPPVEEASSDDSASTVMFRPSELPWADAPAATPLPASAPSGPIAMPTPVAAEPLHAPAPVVEVAEEPQVFEAVLEEDLDFGPAGFESAAGPSQAGGETLFSPETTTVADAPSPTAELSAVSSPPPEPEAEPAPAGEEITSIDDLVTAPRDAPAEPEPSFVEEEALEPEPEPPASQDAAETARVSDSVSAFAVFGRPLAPSESSA